MVALSILQPWAWLIVRPDLTDAAARTEAARLHQIKDVENRTWWTSRRGAFLVHAGKTYSRRQWAEDVDHFLEAFSIKLPDYDAIDRGGIVGQAVITACVHESQTLPATLSRWFNGPHGFVLANQQPLVFRPWKGQLGFFEVPPA